MPKRGWATTRRPECAGPARSASGQRVALHHQVELGPGRPAQEGVAHGAADGADLAAQAGPCGAPRTQRVRRRPARRAALGSGDVAYDPVSRKLSAVAPVAPELVEAFERFEHLTLTELQEGFDAADARFQAWARDPANAGRPITEAPDYLDRIALDSLLERRTWAE